MPLSVAAALIGIVVVLGGLVAVSIAGSPSPSSRRHTGTAGATIQAEVDALTLRPGAALYVDNVSVSSPP